MNIQAHLFRGSEGYQGSLGPQGWTSGVRPFVYPWKGDFVLSGSDSAWSAMNDHSLGQFGCTLRLFLPKSWDSVARG